MDCIVHWVSKSWTGLSLYDLKKFFLIILLKYSLFTVLITAIQKVIQFYICVCVYQFSSVAQLCLTCCNPMDCSTPGFPVHHQFLELTETHVH